MFKLILFTLISCIIFEGISSDCSSNLDCESCTTNSACIWCNSSINYLTPFRCIDGGILGPVGPPTCGIYWYWSQCSHSGEEMGTPTTYVVFLIAFLWGCIVVLTVLLFLILCCACKDSCFRQRCCSGGYKRRTKPSDSSDEEKAPTNTTTTTTTPTQLTASQQIQPQIIVPQPQIVIVQQTPQGQFIQSSGHVLQPSGTGGGPTVINVEMKDMSKQDEQSGSGQEISGQEGSGQEGSGQEGSGQEGSGQERSGQEGSGQEVSGKEVSGQEGGSGSQQKSEEGSH